MSKTSDMWLDEQDAAGDELRCEIDHWKTRAEEAEGLLKPFAEYAAKFDAKPLSSMADVIHGIHMGTEWEAEIRLSDCRNARDFLEEKP